MSVSLCPSVLDMVASLFPAGKRMSEYIVAGGGIARGVRCHSGGNVGRYSGSEERGPCSGAGWDSALNVAKNSTFYDGLSCWIVQRALGRAYSLGS